MSRAKYFSSVTLVKSNAKALSAEPKVQCALRDGLLLRIFAPGGRNIHKCDSVVGAVIIIVKVGGSYQITNFLVFLTM